MTPYPLIEVEDSVLIVIDVQEYFLKKFPPELRGPLRSRIRWLIGVANWLQIPIVVTAEDMDRLGSVDPEVAVMLPPKSSVHNKMTFGLPDDALILGEVARTGRKTAVLIGLETDVCVAHSAVGLVERDYRVVVIADATGSPGDAHTYGLERIRGAGGLILSVKGLLYEWLRTVDQSQRFRAECKELGVPDGTVL
ncbi:MAG: isochorismatase family protein [Gammaproteobacteria bacterium]|nr:isochorismatase family protein [Gammaproteobacteria bacterium]